MHACARAASSLDVRVVRDVELAADHPVLHLAHGGTLRARRGASCGMSAMELVEARRGIADRVVALTFDDGPSPWTEPIAEQLERHGGRGTFFAIGEEVDTDEGRRIVRRLLATGHEVGNHTWTHADLEQIDDETIGRSPPCSSACEPRRRAAPPPG